MSDSLYQLMKAFYGVVCLTDKNLPVAFMCPVTIVKFGPKRLVAKMIIQLRVYFQRCIVVPFRPADDMLYTVKQKLFILGSSDVVTVIAEQCIFLNDIPKRCAGKDVPF